MKEWKLPYKITIVNTGIVIVLGVIVTIANGLQDAGLVFGIVCLIGGLLDLFVGLIMLATPSKDWAKGLLLSSGILLLISGISCGTGLANLHIQ